MSEVPSWLNEDNASTAVKVASNPAVRQAASNPAVRDAVLNNLPPPPPPPKSASANYNDVESGRASEATGSPSEFVVEEQTLKSMQNWHLALRVAYIAAAAFLATAAALSLQSQKDIGLIFFAFYVFFFALMLCCFEFALHAVSRLIAVNFGFMYTLSGRMTFLLFVGFMSFSLSNIGIFAMAFLYACGLFHGYIMYRFPKFEEYLRKKHYFEGRKNNVTV